MLCVDSLESIFRIVLFRDFSIQKYTQCCFMNSLIQRLLASHVLKTILCSLAPFPLSTAPPYLCETCVYMQTNVMYIEGVHATRFLEKV